MDTHEGVYLLARTVLSLGTLGFFTYLHGRETSAGGSIQRTRLFLKKKLMSPFCIISPRNVTKHAMRNEMTTDYCRRCRIN